MPLEQHSGRDQFDGGVYRVQDHAEDGEALRAGAARPTDLDLHAAVLLFLESDYALARSDAELRSSPPLVQVGVGRVPRLSDLSQLRLRV